MGSGGFGNIGGKGKKKKGIKDICPCGFKKNVY